LISTFSDANPTLHRYLSKGNDPSTYTLLNGGKPVLRSTVGTKAVRDVFLATNTARDEWYMICTGEQGFVSSKPSLQLLIQLYRQTLMSQSLAFHGTESPAQGAAEW
jgi:hypothetical protein